MLSAFSHVRFRIALALIMSLLVLNLSGMQARAITVLPEFTIAGGVTSADSDQSNPGKPAISFDGTNHIVVSCRTIGSPTGIFGVLVSRHGDVLTTFPISPTPFCSGALPAVGFDGTNYLVVFGRDGLIRGTRVSPAGAVLDGPNGFVVSSGTPAGTNFGPAVGFNGSTYLVAWGKFIDGNYDIFGARVSPSGQVSSELEIFRAPGEQVSPAIAFDGSSYMVAWRDNRFPPPTFNQPRVVGTRVSADGVVLDPGGIAISTAPGAKGEPQLVFDGRNYFAVWVDGRLDPTCQGGGGCRIGIFGTRIRPDGTLLDGAPDSGGIAINTAQYGQGAGPGQPTLGFDGATYFVAWSADAFFAPTGIFGARVSTAGVLIDGPAEVTGVPIATPHCFACLLVHPTILFNGETYLLAWVSNAEVFGTTKDVVGALVSTAPPDTTPPNITFTETPAPNANGWNNTNVTVTWNVSDPESGIASRTGCDTTTIAEETAGTSVTCSARNGAGLTTSASVLIKIDKTAPVVTFSGNAGTYTVDQTISITCSASDALSGIAASSCPGLSGPAYSLDLGTHSLTGSATDLAGNSNTTSTSFTVGVTYASLCNLSQSFETDPQIADSLCAQLAAAEAGAARNNSNAKAGALRGYMSLVRAQADKTLTSSQAAILTRLAAAL